MRRSVLYIILLFSLIFTGCREDMFQNGPDNGAIVVSSYPLGMTNVDTRSAKNPFELKISYKHMLIFDVNDQLVDYQSRSGEYSTFLIIREDYRAKYNNIDGKQLTDLEKCTIYIIANLPDNALADVKTKQDLLNHKVYSSTLHPDKDKNSLGLVMMGVSSVTNLNPDNKDKGPKVDPIPLQSVYAKIVVDINVNAMQQIPGIISSFQLNKWTVKNAPTYTIFEEPAAGEETFFIKNEQVSPLVFIIHNGESYVNGKNPVSGNEHITFEFYTLEHRINPQNKAQYPGGIQPNEKQRFKPQLVTPLQKPLAVEIEGMYSDHQGHPRQVTYTLYLGENSIDNFYIDRNHCYNNYVTIKGITNSNDSHVDAEEDNISVDYRVDVTPTDMDVSVEREIMLDSHIEIRPLDVELKKPNSHVIVEILDPATTTWMRFEHKNSAPAGDPDYCTNGKRKYFTTNLLQDLDKDPQSKKTTITSNDNNRIWIYFDENLNASTDGMRTGKIKFSFYENGECKREEIYRFMQHDLYPINTPNGKYYIEFYEEYLYNFDPKDKYSDRTDGMAWGLMDVMYSSDLPAVKSIMKGDEDLVSWFINTILKLGGVENDIQTAVGKYDYKDNYNGKVFTDKLIKKGDGKRSFEILELDRPPHSAAEYCYNKNKRNSDGTIPASNFKWYLPAIGEIQDITTVAYSKFAVFQDKYYWSSQTSYKNGTWKYNKQYDYWTFEHGHVSYTPSGVYPYEDVKYARATKTTKENGVVSYVHSETRGITQDVVREPNGPIPVPTIINNTPERDPGNHTRDKILRVRAVRKEL